VKGRSRPHQSDQSKPDMFEKIVVVDCSSHLLGRLASTLAKELLNGQRVVAVRTEEIQISGSLFRNKLIFEKFLEKRTNTNPRRGPFHFRSPARMLWRTIRGMVPHKTKRGMAALGRLQVFEGCPHPFDKMKRVVVPAALRVLRLKPGRKYCRLGDMATAYGWSHNDLIKRLEDKRKTKSAVFYQRKRNTLALRSAALKNLQAKLNALGQEVPVPAPPEIKEAPTKKKKEGKKKASAGAGAVKPAADKGAGKKAVAAPKGAAPKADKGAAKKVKS